MEMCSRPAAQQQEEALRCPELQILQRYFPGGSFLCRAPYQVGGLILNPVEHSRMKKNSSNSYRCFRVQAIWEKM